MKNGLQQLFVVDSPSNRFFNAHLLRQGGDAWMTEVLLVRFLGLVELVPIHCHKVQA